MPMRKFFYFSSVLSLLAVALLSLFWPHALWLLCIIIPYIALGLYDLSTHHNILRNYPVLCHFRYMFEFVRPEIQQYFINTNQSGRPFNREVRSLIYQRAKQATDTLPFGTQQDITHSGYELAFHSLAPKEVSEINSRITVGGPECKQPYHASRLNISAMSFGALSPTAIETMNRGARLGNFAHNTGEGGLSPYHTKHGGDIIFQIGTGYFGVRTKDGHFDAEKFKEKSALDCVKMIEIKLSQGAKPSHGGILPGAKVNEEIAEFRGVEVGVDCISPPTHTAFSGPKGLLEFVQQCRELSGGKPIGFKLCIGLKHEFMAICKAMIKTGITPDFITVDGAEGGTGAAPLEFSNRLGVPIHEAIVFVDSCLIGTNLRDKIKIIASGKVATGFNMIMKLALGADMCNSARGMMFAVGCIQALRCNMNTCPTGVTTQNADRYHAIVPEEKCYHVKNFHDATIRSFLDLTGAMGLTSPEELTTQLIYRRLPNETMRRFSDIYNILEPGELLSRNIHPDYADDWMNASADHF